VIPRRFATALAIAATFAAIGATPAAVAQSHVSVYLLRGEQLAPVTRPGTTPLDAVRQLIAGPTRAEVGLGFRTYVPAATRVLSVKVAHGIATVDLNARFASGGDAASRLARLSQLVRTLTAFEGAHKVRLLTNGGVVADRFPGVPTNRPIGFRFLERPNVPVPEPPQTKRLRAPDPAVKKLQQRLIELGYLLRGDDDGRFGPATQNAVLAFQKWERLGRTGQLNGQTNARLVTAMRPSPRSQGGGKRAEILLDRQVALLISNNRVIRTIAVSSGKPSTPTPPGNYRVYAKIPRWWSVPFREWLPWALPFVGGIAFHEFLVVPTFPASHGCVRQSTTVARWTYNFATVGMPVKVLTKS
jgi:sporulation and spore germination protein/L,D-transpeptidase-like protein/putative peptidoglycan binding protein